MCDHCRTYKPVLDRKVVGLTKQPTQTALATPTVSRSINNGGTSCCSWRQTCCGGGCCGPPATPMRNGGCCSAQPEVTNSSREKSATVYGYGYGSSQTRMPMASTTVLPYGTSCSLPDRVPCKSGEQKIPMCEGGDCDGAEDEEGTTNSIRRLKSDDNQTGPRESDR